MSEEERGAHKCWLFDVSECDDDTTDAERSVGSFSYLSVRGSLICFILAAKMLENALSWMAI